MVEEKYGEKEISIKVKGIHQRDLMTIIAAEIDKLNGEYEGIEVQKLIPCNCSNCMSLAEPYFYSYNKILKRIEDNKDTIECQKSPYENVAVSSLRDSFFNNNYPEIDRLERRGKYSNVEVNIEKIIFGDDRSQKNKTGANGTIISENEIDLSVHNNTKPAIIPFFQEWWVRRLLAAFATGIFAALGAKFVTQLDSLLMFYLITGIVGIVLLKQGNPARRYYRAAKRCLSIAVGLTFLQSSFSFEFEKQLDDGFIKTVFKLGSQWDWLFVLVFALLAVFLFWLDFKKYK